MAYQIGDRVGDYQIMDVLGAGGMGKVYKVRNTISDRVEAMKVLLPNLESDPELADRFMREIKVQASLDHPNIAGLHTALRINNQLIMLIEFVEGRTIEAELRNGTVPVAKSVEYMKQALAALSYAHARGVVHRDIKPANMMLMPDGTVKLMDFGIARMTADRKLTQTGRTVGSLYYMSPEQIQGSVDLDGRSDLYSIGVSLYEMCTNRRPFQGDSDYSIMAAHLTSAPVAPIEIDPSLPASLNEIILMAIAKDPGQRFQTAEAFRSALNSVTSTISAAPMPYRKPPVMSEVHPQAPGSKRGLYMAIGSVVTIAVLAVAALQAPKLFKSSSAQTISVQPPPAVAQEPAKSEPKVTEPVAEPKVTEPKVIVQNRPVQQTPTVTNTPTVQQEPPVHQPVVQKPVVQQPVVQPPQQAAPPTPVPPAVNIQELDDLRDRMMLLATRANSIRASLASLQKQMGSLNLNAEFTTREQRMEAFLDQAEGALKSSDAARSKKSLDAAERVIEELEKKLGR